MLAENLYYSGRNDFVDDEGREQISLFSGLDEKQLDKLYALMTRLNVDHGDQIFAQGQLPCNIYIVHYGLVNLQVDCGEDSTSVINYASGDCFGETAVLGAQPQMGRAISVGNTQLLVLSQSVLMALLEYDAPLFAVLMINVTREISRQMHGMVNAKRDDSECFFGKSNYVL
ncbi:MAG: hypothetical protein COA42_07560 [Alteromonadaceae bacterium]|nr:MAG: hypothetical protein COA42_07560 [Alteromonadaceae bacterium]